MAKKKRWDFPGIWRWIIPRYDQLPQLQRLAQEIQQRQPDPEFGRHDGLFYIPREVLRSLKNLPEAFFCCFFFPFLFSLFVWGEKMAWSQNRMGTSSKSNGFETHILSHRVALRVWLEGFAELMFFCHFTQENPPFGKNKRLINLLVVVQQIHVSDLHSNLSQNVMFHGFSYIF